MPQGGLTPRRARLAADGGTSLAAAVRMVGRVHDRASHAGPLAHAARTAGFTDGDEGVLLIAHLAEGGYAGDVNQPLFARGHADGGVVSLLGHELGLCAGGANQDTAAAR